MHLKNNIHHLPKPVSPVDAALLAYLGPEATIDMLDQCPIETYQVFPYAAQHNGMRKFIAGLDVNLQRGTGKLYCDTILASMGPAVGGANYRREAA